MMKKMALPIFSWSRRPVVCLWNSRIADYHCKSNFVSIKKIFSIFISCACFLLIGCFKQPIFNTACVDKRTCKNTCLVQLNQCRLVCEDSCLNCEKKSILSAVNNYTKYVHEQQIQGGMVTNQLKSYRDPLQCRKTTCNCIADYNVCVQAKSGIIHKRLQVNAACER